MQGAGEGIEGRVQIQETHDVVVLGSGLAGLTAALAAALDGADVVLLEKAELIGGTTALSGAGIWIPGNPIAAEQGVEDSLEEGATYLESLSNGMILPELAEALISGGPRFVDFLHEHTDLRLRLVEGYPDYHPEHPRRKARGWPDSRARPLLLRRDRAVDRPHRR